MQILKVIEVSNNEELSEVIKACNTLEIEFSITMRYQPSIGLLPPTPRYTVMLHFPELKVKLNET